MKKPSNSVFITALAATMLAAGALFGSPAYAQQGSSPSGQQAPTSSTTQDSSATSRPAKPAAKTTPETKPAAKASATKAAATKPTPTAASQADAPAKASSSASGTAASTKQAPAAPAGQTGATKTGSAATRTTKPGASKASTAKTAATLALNTPKDKQSYAIGVNVGKGLNQNLKQGGVDIDPAILVRGIKDVLAGDKQLMTDQEAQATLTALQADMRKAQEEKTKQLAEANKKEGDEFLAANKTKEDVVTLPDGLQYKILQEGTGPKPAATDSVVVNYRGTFLNGTEFDSSYKRGQPATFSLGPIIKGWSEALQLMPVGSKWQLFIPSDLAYGVPGRPPMIGPNSTLVFEVELVSIQPKPAAAPAPAAALASTPAPAAATPNAPTPSPVPTANPPTPAPKPTPPAPTPTPTPTPKPPTP